jgi:hypothetical protein
MPVPPREQSLPWLSYVHQLKDVDELVACELYLMFHYEEKKSGNLSCMQGMLRRVEELFDRQVALPGARTLTTFTTWGDVDLMMTRAHGICGSFDTGNMDWASAIEEGWMPYNVFSLHLLEKEKTVVDTCNPDSTF